MAYNWPLYYSSRRSDHLLQLLWTTGHTSICTEIDNQLKYFFKKKSYFYSVNTVVNIRASGHWISLLSLNLPALSYHENKAKAKFLKVHDQKWIPPWKHLKVCGSVELLGNLGFYVHNFQIKWWIVGRNQKIHNININKKHVIRNVPLLN